MDNIFKNVCSVSGLPVKSYLYIMEYDFYMKALLSKLSLSPTFDQLIADHITYHFKITDRRVTANAFIKYMCCNSTDRLNFVYATKVFTRTNALRLLSNLKIEIDNMNNIQNKIKKGIPPTQEELDSYSKTVSLIGTDRQIKKFIIDTYYKIQELIENLYTNLKSYIIKLILSRRKGDSDPDHLRTDAYEVILKLLDKYELEKSKVSFTTALQWFAKNRKAELIAFETWGIKDRKNKTNKKVLSIESFIEERDITSLNKIEKNLEEWKQRSDNTIIDVIYKYLSQPFKECLIFSFDIVEHIGENDG